MARAKWIELLRSLRQIYAQGEGTGTTDGQLLDRFAHQHDESAFELLVFRHGGMVLKVCRRVLDRDQDAEDAFQATFLTLVRKAHSIRRQGALAGWLYRVAYRAALETRARSARIARHEKAPHRIVESPAVADAGWNEVRPILDEEIDRLPERIRMPLVLCYLEGKTNEQAARELGCPVGTVFSRLAKGREMLRTRLVRRGLTLSAAGLMALLADQGGIAAPSSALLTSALEAGRLAAAGKVGAVAVKVHAITEGVLKAMFVQKLKNAAAVLLVLVLLAAGGSGLVYQALTAAPPGQIQTDPPPAAPQAKGHADNKNPDKAGPGKPRELIAPKKGGVERVSAQPGTLTAYEAVEVMPQVSGTLKKLNVDIGDRVKSGDLLAEIDAPDLVKDAEQAKIALELARGKVALQEAQVASTEVEYRSAESAIIQRDAETAVAALELTRWEQELTQAKKLAEQGVVAQGTVAEAVNHVQTGKRRVDAAKAALETAKIEKELKQSKVRLAQAVLRIEKLQIESARVGLERAEMILSSTRITAPLDGIVTTRSVNAGNFVSAKTAHPIIRIIRTERMRLVVSVPEQEAIHVRVGMDLTITIGTEFSKTIRAKVARFSSSLDEKARTMRVEADVANPDGLLLDGMYGIARIKLGIIRPEALVIPHSCLTATPTGRPAVFVAKDGKALLTEIDGQGFGDLVEVHSGLRANDQIVADPNGVVNGEAIPKK